MNVAWPDALVTSGVAVGVMTALLPELAASVTVLPAIGCGDVVLWSRRVTVMVVDPPLATVAGLAATDEFVASTAGAS